MEQSEAPDMAQHVLPPRATELRDDLDYASTLDALNGGQLYVGESRSELNGTRLQYAQGQGEDSGPGLEFLTTGVDHHSFRRPVDRRDGFAEKDSVSKRAAELLPQPAVAVDQDEVGVPRLETPLMGSRGLFARCQISEAFRALSSSGGIGADVLKKIFSAASSTAPVSPPATSTSRRLTSSDWGVHSRSSKRAYASSLIGSSSTTHSPLRKIGAFGPAGRLMCVLRPNLAMNSHVATAGPWTSSAPRSPGVPSERVLV